MNMLLSTLFFAVSSVGSRHAQGDNSDKEVMQVINRYSKSIKKEKGILLRLHGLDYAGPDKVYDGKIHEIALGYSLDKGMKYEEAKNLFYSVVDGLLIQINQTESIKKYFYHSPVGYRDLHIFFAFDYENKGLLKRNEVDSIHIAGNKIYYYIAEKDAPKAEIKQNQIIPDVYIMENMQSETRCIERDLPEGPEADSD